MTNLTATPGWDPVLQLELTTIALAGDGGVMNVQAQALLNRLEALASNDPAMGAAIIGNASIRVDTVAALRALATPTRKTLVQVEGYYAAGDGGGGVFMWIPASTNADNGGTVIIPDGAPSNGRWERGVEADGHVGIHKFGARGIGSSFDDRPAFVSALASGLPIRLDAGDFYLSDHIKPTNGSRIILKGVHRDKVTVKCAAGRIPIFCDNAPGTDIRLTGAHIEGITFDGGHVRTPASFPYNADAGASMTQALNLRGTKGDGDQVDFTVTRCRFKNINGLPVWIADADGSVEFSFNHLYRTKDPGFLYCDDLKIIGNTVEYGADNGLSISRSNKRFYIAYNHVRDTASSGIFMGGVNSDGASGSLTLSGASYAAGATLTMAATGATPFGTEDKGNNFTLRSGSNVVVVRVTAVAANNSATVVALAAVPAALQNTATADWSRGPIMGGQSGVIANNVCEGGSNYGINLSMAPQDVAVHDNVIRRTGITRDSETFTTGTIFPGSTSMEVASSSGFAIGDWICSEPDYTHGDYFIAQITNIVGTTWTLSASPVRPVVLESVHRAYRRTAAYGLATTGYFENASFLEFAEGLDIHDNLIVDSVTGGMRLGSNSGAIRKSEVHHNRVDIRQTAHLDTQVFGILIGDVGTTAMRTVLLDVHSNSISLDGAIGVGVEYKPVDSNVASYIRIRDNRIRQAAANVRVTEQTGSTDITASYMPTTLTGSLSAADLLNTDVLGMTAWAAATVAAGVLTLTRTLNVHTPGSQTTVTDVVISGINHATPLLVVRNGSGSNSITFTNNSAKIRTKTGADVVVPPNGSITFVPISSTLVQQVA